MSQPESVSSVARRDFLKLTLAATGAAMLESASAAPQEQALPGLVDVNVSLSRWPFRRLPLDDTNALAAKLRQAGVTQAWAGSFDGLFHADLSAVNARLAEECRRFGQGLFVPMGSINPKSPDWETDLRRCAEEFHTPGIRLSPAYHGYKLDDPDFARLLRLATDKGLLVQIVFAVEDPRGAYPLLRVEPVDAAPLPQVVKQIPGLRLVLLNAVGSLPAKPLLDLIVNQGVCFDLTMLEGVGGIEKILTQVPLERVLFGSHSPFYYFESAELKLEESALTPAQQKAIRVENAQRLLMR